MRNFLKKTEGYPAKRPYVANKTNRRRRPVPDKISRFYIPLQVLEATNKAMRRFGEEKRECYIWWGGYFTPDGEGQVVTALCPDIHTEYGRVHLRLQDLLALQSHLRTLDLVLLVELHTHPSMTGQNDVDAAHPAASYPGFVSIVVPNFASPLFYDLRSTFIYEYISSNKWHQLNRDEIQNRFVIEEPFISVKGL